MAEKKHIFISYGGVHKDMVWPYAQLLESNGYTVFLDHISINPGDEWMQTLTDALLTSERVYFFWCCHSSRSAWVDYEIRLATDLAGVKIIPCLFCSAPLPPALSRHQFIDFRDLVRHDCEPIVLVNDYDRANKKLSYAESTLSIATRRLRLASVGVLLWLIIGYWLIGTMAGLFQIIVNTASMVLLGVLWFQLRSKRSWRDESLSKAMRIEAGYLMTLDSRSPDSRLDEHETSGPGVEVKLTLWNHLVLDEKRS